MQFQESSGRREVLRAGLRGVALLILAGSGLALALRENANACPPRTACDVCRLRRGCARQPSRAREAAREERS